MMNTMADPIDLLDDEVDDGDVDIRDLTSDSALFSDDDVKVESSSDERVDPLNNGFLEDEDVLVGSDDVDVDDDALDEDDAIIAKHER